MKKFLKLYRTYQNLNDRVNTYASYKQLLLATLLAIVSAMLWVIPSLWLISYLLTQHAILAIVTALVVVLISTFGYFSLLFLYLRWVCPKLKEVRVRLIIVFDALFTFLVLGLIVTIFLTTLIQRSGL